MCNERLTEFREALHSTSPETAVGRLVHEHPDLVATIGGYWADGFATEQIPPAVARLLIARGAPLSVHAAAGFGFTDCLSDLVGNDPSLIHAKGGDGCTPLHFARDVATAEFLLEPGAHIDARDDDHQSTRSEERRVGKECR